ncbi:MAG TPA: sigma-70 family RNA polymerase sigma factor, partial [Planctomycetota bacterium]|nr:sigma-70 family RNA polymerase sigma factor [Planctomycetota bacterium]
MQPSAEDLFERWRSRADSRALASLFDRTAAELWRVARHLTGNRHEADDLVQATYLAAIESAPRWRRELPLVPWLFGILANKLRMARRRARRSGTLSLQRAPTPANDPVDDASHTELRELLQQRLAALPETYRAVLVLQLEHGLTAAEVAHALGRSRATVRSQLHRGLELLRGSLPASVAPPHGRDERPPDLRAVRGAVLLAAGVPATTTATLGATILMKKLLAVTLALLLGGAWFAWPSSDAARPTPVPGTTTPAASRGVPVADQGPSVVAASPRQDVTPAAPVGGDASAVVVRVLWSDGSPAAAMWICLEPAGAHDWFAQRWQTADGAGLVRFARVAPGSYRARSRHGGDVDVDVAAGAGNEVELRIPEGIDVRGTVVDPAGNLVPNAVIVLGTRSEDGLEAARSDGNGAFFL